MSASTPDSDESRIEEILGQWFELQMAGAEPQLDELAKDAPHLIERVRAMLERQGELLGPVEAASSRRPLPVDKLGDYELKSRIGSGGMGDVYLAREVALDRMVAVKVLRQELAEDRLRRLRFKREAQLTAALDHPNIVPIYGTGEDEGYVFLVMKLLPGMTLDRVPGLWQPREIAAIGACIARALHAAHEVEIVHRDIKPGNIQVDGDDAWVLDFGLARGRVDLTLTAHGEAPGTLAYMPPEQLRGSPGGLDPRGDIYSLGATLYQCVAGKPPFEAESPELLVRQALLHDPKPLDLTSADRDYWTIVQRALEKDPDRRFASANEFAEDLERFLSGEPIQSRPPSTLTRCVKLARRYRSVTAALMAALLVLAALIPKFWLDARERSADLTRQLDAVHGFLRDGVPALALGRIHELEARDDAGESVRFQDLAELTRATLMRDALLDRIQLDCVYRQILADDEFSTEFSSLPVGLRKQPMTHVAWFFLARERGDVDSASQYLQEAETASACKRLVAAWSANREGKNLGQVLANTPVGTMKAEDYVFTAVLLRMVDAPSDLVRDEIEAAVAVGAEHPRVRMMQAIWHLIGGAPARAAEVFQLLIDPKRPRAELQVMLAMLANVVGDPGRARKHLEAAGEALRVTERPANRWVALQEVGHLILSAQWVDAEAALARARAQFGDDEWLTYAEARLLQEKGDLGAARDLLDQLIVEAVVPWNRRCAAGLALQIDAATDEELTLPAIEDLVRRAEVLARDARSVDDNGAVAEAMMVRASIADSLRELFEGGDADQFKRWDACYWDSLQQVLAAIDLHQDATLLAAEYVSHRVVDVLQTGGDGFVVGGQAVRVGRRAVALTRRGYYGGHSIPRLAALAAFGSLLSAHVKDVPVAVEMGSIARAVMSRRRIPDASDVGAIEALLDQALERLGRKDWPPAPPRSAKSK